MLFNFICSFSKYLFLKFVVILLIYIYMRFKWWISVIDLGFVKVSVFISYNCVIFNFVLF